MTFYKFFWPLLALLVLYYATVITLDLIKEKKKEDAKNKPDMQDIHVDDADDFSTVVVSDDDSKKKNNLDYAPSLINHLHPASGDSFPYDVFADALDNIAHGKMDNPIFQEIYAECNNAA